MLFQAYFILHIVGELSKEHILAVYYAIPSSFDLYGVDPKDILYPCYSYSIQLPWITFKRCILSIACISLTSTGEVLSCLILQLPLYSLLGVNSSNCMAKARSKQM